MKSNNLQCHVNRFFFLFRRVERAVFTDRNIKYAIIVSNKEFAESANIDNSCTAIDNEHAFVRNDEGKKVNADQSVPRNSREQLATSNSTKYEFFGDNALWTSDKWNEQLLAR